MKSNFFFFLLFLSLSLVLAKIYVFHFPSEESQKFGDLRIYKNAFLCNQSNLNPYELESCLEKKGRSKDFAAPVWNPPWFFSIAIPLLTWKSFDGVVLFYILASFISIFLILNVLKDISLYETLDTKPLLLAILLTTLFCSPIILTLFDLGQISLLLLTFQMLALFSFSKKWDWLTGFFLALVTIKPHFCFLISGFIVFKSALLKRYIVILAGALSLVLLTSFQFLINPNLFSFWINTSRLPLEYQGSNIPSLLIRSEILSQSNLLYYLLISVCISLIFLITLISRRNSLKTNDDFKDLTGPLICLSLLAAPYGFLFDQIGLLIPTFELVSLTLRRKCLISMTLITLSFSIWIFNPFNFPLLSYYSLFPLLVLIARILVFRFLK